MFKGVVLLDHVAELLRHQRLVSSSPNGLTRTADVEAAFRADWTDTERARGMTRQEFSDRILRAFIEHTALQWRLGQSAFNIALALWREDTYALVGSAVDPFYDDSRLGAFIDALFGGDR